MKRSSPPAGADAPQPGSSAFSVLSFALDAASAEDGATRLLNGLQLAFDLGGAVVVAEGADGSRVLSACDVSEEWTKRWEGLAGAELLERLVPEPIAEPGEQSPGKTEDEPGGAGFRWFWPAPLAGAGSPFGALVLVSRSTVPDRAQLDILATVTRAFGCWLEGRVPGRPASDGAGASELPVLERDTRPRGESTRRFDEVWGALPVALLDAHGRIAYASGPLVPILAPRNADLHGTPLDRLLFSTDVPRFRAALARARAEGTAPLAAVRAAWTPVPGAARENVDFVFSTLGEHVLAVALREAPGAGEATRIPNVPLPAANAGSELGMNPLGPPTTAAAVALLDATGDGSRIARSADSSGAGDELPGPSPDPGPSPGEDAEPDDPISERFADALEAQPDLTVVRLDRGGRVVSWPDAARGMLGWTSDELIGRPFGELFEDERERFESLVAGCASNTGEWAATARTSDESLHPLGIRFLFSSDDVVSCLLRSRQVEEASERWLRWSRALLSVLGASSLVLDPGGRLHEIGTAWLEPGSKPTDWLGRHVTDLFDTERREVLSALRAAARNGHWTGTLVRHGTAVQVRFQAVRDDSGEIEAIVGAHLPDALSDARDLFRKIPAGMILVGADFAILETNPQLRAVCGDGVVPEDPIGTDVRTLPVFDTEDFRGAWDRLVAEGHLDLTEVRLGGDGEGPRVGLRAAALTQDSGAIVGYVLTLLARSGHEGVDRRAARTQRMESIGSVATGLAHDFGNYASTILGKAGVLRPHLQDVVDAAETLADIEGAAKQAHHLSQELMKFAKGGRRPDAALDLNAMIEAVRSLIVTSVGSKVDVSFHLAGDLGPIEGDEVELQQLVLNLSMNARDAMPDGGTLEIETRRATQDQLARLGTAGEVGGGASLLVRDTGRGIPSDVRDRVFEPFFTTKAEAKGAGLGLATAYGIVRRHGGTIDLTSEPGAGTTFEILLPSPLAAPREEAPAKTILVVDDEPAFRDLMQIVLETDGHRTVLATNGLEALEILRAEHRNLSLVILDLRMPGLSGGEVLDELRRLTTRLPVLVATGYATPEEKERALGRGAVRILEKPYRVNELRSAVAEAFRIGSSVEEAEDPEAEVESEPSVKGRDR